MADSGSRYENLLIFSPLIYAARIFQISLNLQVSVHCKI